MNESIKEIAILKEKYNSICLQIDKKEFSDGKITQNLTTGDTYVKPYWDYESFGSIIIFLWEWVFSCRYTITQM